ncbi:MAG TPA: ACT domain-containing protein [Armatimonadota bacterium]|nr:ACT domain-containing protein [Armatimonadota bacterium]
MTAVQISVFLENKSGRLAEVTSALAKASVNIRALSLAETIDYGVLRLIVDKPSAARKALSEAGFTVTETEVIGVEMPDRPGGLASIVNLVTQSGLNIEYLYAFVGQRGQNAVVIFRIDDVSAAVAALQQGGARILSADELSSI